LAAITGKVGDVREYYN